MKRYETFMSKLASSGVSEECVKKLDELYGEKIEKASFATRSDTGMAYEGSMVDVALMRLALFAVKVNELYPEEIRADKKSVVKVCLLQHISKCERIIDQTDDWRLVKLGEVFQYNSDSPAIGVGLHSLMMACKAGIDFTPDEVEAMTIIDRDDNDPKTKFFSGILAVVVKQANDMVHAYHHAVERKRKQAK